MKRALHRSIIFWFGILVMAFISWAWRDSCRFESRVTIGVSKRTLLDVANTYGGIAVILDPDFIDFDVSRTRSFTRQPCSFRHQHDYMPLPCLARGMSRESTNPVGLEERADDMTFLVYQRERAEMSVPGYCFLLVPYWLFLLACAFPWSALLLWRARRRKRAVEKNPDLAPS